MLDDFQPIIHELEGRDIRLYPVADVHIGAAEAALPEFEAFLRKVKDDPDAYICIVGDLLNNAVKSSVSDVYRETMSPSAAVDYAVEKLQPIADRILAIVGGNHERRSTKEVDLDPLYCVASMLRRSDGSSLQDIYRPSMAFMRVKLKRGRVKDTYAIMMTHGKSQAKKKRFSAIVEGVDAQIYAHTHTPDVLKPARIRFNESNKVSIHDVVTLTACSWVKAGGYSLQGLFEPQAVAQPQCLLLEFINSNDIRGRLRVVW